MIHRAEQQGDIINIAFKIGQIDGITLCDGYGFAFDGVLLKDFDIVLNQFDCIHLIAPLCQSVAVSACCRADLQDAHLRLEVLFNIFHRRDILHHAMF